MSFLIQLVSSLFNPPPDESNSLSTAVLEVKAELPQQESKPATSELEKTLGHEVLQEVDFLPQEELQEEIELSIETLIDAEVSFIEIRSKALRYLVSLPEKERLNIKLYVKIFQRLQNDGMLLFKDYEKVHLLKLILLITTGPDKTSLVTFSDLNELLHEAFLVRQTCGEEILMEFCSASFFRKRAPLEDVLQALKWMHILEQERDCVSFLEKDQQDFYPYLTQFSSGNLALDELLTVFENCISEQDFNPEQFEREPVELKKKFLEAVSFPLKENILDEILKEYAALKKYCQDWRNFRIHQLVEIACKIRENAKTASIQNEDILKLLAIARLALRIKFGLYPHDTQMIAILGLLHSEKGNFAQVKTGEGKSTLVVLISFVKAMQALPVDVISSSHYLAIRDWRKHAPFFQEFGIKTSHLCVADPKPELFGAHIYYATATDLEFAIMRERLYFEKLFEQRMLFTDLKEICHTVIIDELDNLMIDTLMNSARLSINAEISYEWAYLPVLQYVREKNMNSTTTKELRLHLECYQEGRFKELAASLNEEQLQLWLKSAYAALIKQENKDYVINEKKLHGRSIGKQVLIVDVDNTGKIFENCRWAGGLHEILEAKHNIPIEKENLVPISMSHPVFYERYKSICGLTGTLGSAEERNEIKEIYGIDSFDVPPHQPSNRIDLQPLILETDEEYFKAILNSILLMKKNRRPVLVMTQTIFDSYQLDGLLNQLDIPHQMLNGVQNDDEDEIISTAGLPGKCVIGTNKAGRGIDIPLDEVSLEQGGLHCILTFYPESQRVEEQAFGRAGRQGQRGSTQLILSSQRLNANQLSDLKNARQERELTLKQMRVRRANQDRFCSQLTNQFFEKLADFHAFSKNECFLRLPNKMEMSKISSNDLSRLDQKDRVIAQEFLRLTSHEISDPKTWQHLQNDCSIRIKNKALVAWATHFYRPLEILLSTNEGHPFEEKVLELYETTGPLWQKYLNPDGFETYLKEILKE